MSDFTKIVRAAGLGGVLDLVENAEKAVGILPKAPTLPNAEAAVAATTEAANAVRVAATPQNATVLVQDAGSFIGAAATALLGKKLGFAAPLAEGIVNTLISDFEKWLEAKF